MDESLLHEVKSAARRIHVGSCGACIECESATSPKRLAAVHGQRIVSSARTLPTGI
jgi:RNA polymerase-binding transcription factor DksA